MTRTTFITTVAIGLAIALSAGIASARATHDSTPVIDDAGELSDDMNTTYFVGHVDTNTKKCLSHRRIKLFGGYVGEDHYRLIDTTVSSKNGSFAGNGPGTHAGNTLTAGKAVMAPKDTASGRCTGGKATIE